MISSGWEISERWLALHLDGLGAHPKGWLPHQRAAHAACFTMSFVRLLGMANFVPEQVDSKSEVVIDKDGDGFSITSVHLTVTAKIPGIDQDTFQSIAAKAKAGCPVSKLIKVGIGFEATLSP